MIVRMWRAVATPENAPRYRAHLEGTVAPELHTLPGFMGLSLCETEGDGGRVEIVVLTRWRSMRDVKDFAGPDPKRAVVEPEAKAVLTNCDDFVSHYHITLEVPGHQ
jgi:heme-degrading monooxygenase HmoA